MAEEKINVLIVDDRPEKLMALESIISDLGNIVKADSGKNALRALMQQEFAVILLDVNMPGMDGFETAAMIRSRDITLHTPIIFITSYTETETHVSRGYSLGAVDYIHAPILSDVVRAKVAVFVDLFKKTQQIKKQAEERVQLAREQAARAQAETAQRRSSFLAEASKTLASSLESSKVMQRLVELCVPYFADWAAIELAQSDSSICLTALAGVDAGRAQLARDLFKRYPKSMHDQHGTAELIRSQTTRLIDTVDDNALRAFAAHEEHVVALRAFKFRSFIAVPLAFRQRVQGVLIVAMAESGRSFNASDVSLAEDLASRVSMAIENSLLYADAEQANRAKDEFLAVVSHELRTPLTPILGWTRMLAQERLDAASVQHAIAIIERNARAQTKLIEDLLDVSRIVTGKFKLNVRPTDINSVVENAIEAVRTAADARNINIARGSACGACVTTADPDRLQQVLWNLLINAIKFSPDNSEIVVGLEMSQSHISLRVIDRGRGIAAEFLPFVFDRFRQADSTTTRSTGGLGIGLAIVRHIVELHGGSVSVQSEGDGKGSEFTVTLPVQKPAGNWNGSGSSAPAQTDGARLTGLKILVVEDDEDTRDLVSTILSSHGAAVTDVGNARDAMKTISDSRPDVLVSDIGMPGMDGYALIKNVRQLNADSGGLVPAIALTAYAKDEDQKRAIAAGFQRHISKPIDPVDLVSAVASVVPLDASSGKI